MIHSPKVYGIFLDPLEKVKLSQMLKTGSAVFYFDRLSRASGLEEGLSHRWRLGLKL